VSARFSSVTSCSTSTTPRGHPADTGPARAMIVRLASRGGANSTAAGSLPASVAVTRSAMAGCRIVSM
jgi:hypothetical protein